MLNSTIITGRLTADPDLRRTLNNVPVLSVTVAVERDIRKDDGSKEVDFIDVVVWNTTAEFVSKWFEKGDMITISGRLQTRNWEDKNGNKHKAVEVIAERAYFSMTKKKKEETEPIITDDDFTEDMDDGQVPF